MIDSKEIIDSMLNLCNTKSKGWIYKVEWYIPRDTQLIGNLSKHLVIPTLNGNKLFLREYDSISFRNSMHDHFTELNLYFLGAKLEIGVVPYE